MIMLKGVIYCTVETLKEELYSLFSNITFLCIQFIDKPEDLKLTLKKNSILFLLLALENETETIPILKLHRNYPHSFLILYHKTLNARYITQSELSSFNHIIVGDGRQENLYNLVYNLSETYWKKIPYHRMGLSYQKLSTRLKKVMHYIETHDLKECNSARIAEHLEISKGYFSQEFKRETDLNYREFMQNLLAYYERILFEEMDVSAQTASSLLGYSELSSFSRSFKKRKGYSPSHLRKHAI